MKSNLLKYALLLAASVCFTYSVCAQNTVNPDDWRGDTLFVTRGTNVIAGHEDADKPDWQELDDPVPAVTGYVNPERISGGRDIPLFSFWIKGDSLIVWTSANAGTGDKAKTSPFPLVIRHDSGLHNIRIYIGEPPEATVTPPVTATTPPASDRWTNPANGICVVRPINEQNLRDCRSRWPHLVEDVSHELGENELPMNPVEFNDESYVIETSTERVRASTYDENSVVQVYDLRGRQMPVYRMADFHTLPTGRYMIRYVNNPFIKPKLITLIK